MTTDPSPRRWSATDPDLVELIARTLPGDGMSERVWDGFAVESPAAADHFRRKAATLLDALAAAGLLRDPRPGVAEVLAHQAGVAEGRAEAAEAIRRAAQERRDDIGRRPLHPEAVEAYEHAAKIAEGKTDG